MQAWLGTSFTVAATQLRRADDLKLGAQAAEDSVALCNTSFLKCVCTISPLKWNWAVVVLGSQRTVLYANNCALSRLPSLGNLISMRFSIILLQRWLPYCWQLRLYGGWSGTRSLNLFITIGSKGDERLLKNSNLQQLQRIEALGGSKWNGVYHQALWWFSEVVLGGLLFHNSKTEEEERRAV